jgi:hypothetical protein
VYELVAIVEEKPTVTIAIETEDGKVFRKLNISDHLASNT